MNAMHGGLASVTTTVTRKGRKRKSGRRTSHGDLAKKRPDDRILATLQPHRRDLPERHRLSEKAVTVLGRLNLFGRITDEQLEAGRKYAAGVNAYRAVIGAIDPLLAPAPGYSTDISPEEAKRRTDDYNQAFELLDALGSKPIRAVNRAAVYDDACYGELSHLLTGLSALVRFYGLRSGK